MLGRALALGRLPLSPSRCHLIRCWWPWFSKNGRHISIPAYTLLHLRDILLRDIHVKEVRPLTHRSRSKQGGTWTRNLVLAASIIMYIASAAHWAINIALLVRGAKNGTVGGIFITPVEELAYAYLPAISYVLSDAIVVWRAWVLWERRYELLIPPILFMLGTIAVSVADANITFKSPTTDTWQEVQISDRLGYCIWGFTILTNLWATGLICIKTWQHRRFIRSLMGKSTQRTRAEKALAFLIESSSIYLCIWITWVTVNVTSHPNSIGGLLVFYPVIVQIIGIYPTVIVVVVTMRLSTADVLSRHGRSEQLAPPVFVSRSLEPASSYGSTSDTDNTARTYTSIHLQMKDQSSN